MRIGALAMVICITVITFTSAETNIIDSMNFEGEKVTLTLEEAIETMINDNPTIEKAKLDLEQAEVNYDDIRSDIKKADKIIDDEDSLQGLQAIKLPQLQADFLVANAERNYDATVEGLKANIEEVYYSLLQAQELVEINKANVDVANDLYEKTQKKFELGLVAKQEVLNSELSLIQAENEYKSAVDNVKKAKMALNTQLGYNVMTNIELEDQLTFNDFEVPSIAEAVSSALENRMEIKAAEFNYELEKLNMEIVAKQYPEITYMYREQKVVLEKALKDLETAKKNIEMEVRSNYLDVLQKQENINSSQKSVELAEEALRLSELSYDVGMSVLTDVQKAQTALKQAKLGLSKAILDYNLAILKFEDSISVGRAN